MKFCIWKTLKQVTVSVSLIMIVGIIVCIVLIMTQRISVKIEQYTTAVVSENVTMKMPVIFQLNDRTSISGDAIVIMQKGTVLPINIKMSLPISVKEIVNVDSPVSVKLEKGKKGDKDTVGRRRQ